jgi:hypothetical protein
MSGLMQATEFEFRYRLWIIAAIFVVAFLLYRVDHQVAAVVILRQVSPEHSQVDLSSSMHWRANWQFNARSLSVRATLALIKAVRCPAAAAASATRPFACPAGAA